MVAFPVYPVPSSVSAPAIIDPVLTFATDSGYTLRRSKASRPRRRFTIEYLGRTTNEMRNIVDFIQFFRFGALPFEWAHPTASDGAVINNTTPVILTYTHGLFTGQYIFVGGFAPTPLVGIHQVTRIDTISVSLNGTTAVGAGTALVYLYLPSVVTVHAQDTWDSPTKLIGPDQLDFPLYSRRSGVFNFTVVIEEQF